MTHLAERSKGDLISIKRKITEAGRIQDKIADDLKRLEELKKEIKNFETGMAVVPENEVVLVSGEYVATLSAEAARHVTGPKANRALFGMIGMDKFLDISTFPIPAMEKAVGKDQFATICPKEYNGTGRRFSLKPKA